MICSYLLNLVLVAVEPSFQTGLKLFNHGSEAWTEVEGKILPSASFNMYNFLSAVFELRPTYQRDANKKGTSLHCRQNVYSC